MIILLLFPVGVFGESNWDSKPNNCVGFKDLIFSGYAENTQFKKIASLSISDRQKNEVFLSFSDDSFLRNKERIYKGSLKTGKVRVDALFKQERENQLNIGKITYNSSFFQDKILAEIKTGIIEKEVRAGCCVFYPLSIQVSHPLSHNSEISGWGAYLLGDDWDEIGWSIDHRSKFKKIDLGLFGKSQSFNSKNYFSCSNRNEISIQAKYNFKFISPYVCFEKVRGGNDFNKEIIIAGSTLDYKKIHSDVSYNYDVGYKMKTLEYSVNYNINNGNIGLQTSIQSADWMQKSSKEFVISYQFGGADKNKNRNKASFFNDPIKMSRAIDLSNLECAKRIVDTPRKATEMMSQISYALNWDKPADVYEERSGTCWSQSNLFSDIIADKYETYVVNYYHIRNKGDVNGHAFSVFIDGGYWLIYEYGRTWKTNIRASVPIENAVKDILFEYLSTNNDSRPLQLENGDEVLWFFEESLKSNPDGKHFYSQILYRDIFYKTNSPRAFGGLKEVIKNEDEW